MSSDFLVDTNDLENQKFVIQVKYTESFADKRTIEKLEIERRYWELKGIPWFLVTERQIDKVIKSNVDWLYAVKGYHDELITEDLERQMHFMSAYFQKEPERRVIDICKAFDTAYQLELGQSLHDFRQLCAARLITFDIRQSITQLRAKEVTFRGAANNTGANYVAG
jgi:hypothetical protein